MSFRNPVTTLPANKITPGTLAGTPGAGRLDLTSTGLNLYGPDGVTVLAKIDPAGFTAAGRFTADDPSVAGSAFVMDGQLGFTDPRSPVTTPGNRWNPGGTTSSPVGPRMVRNSAGGLVLSGRQPATYSSIGQPLGYRDGAQLVLDSTDATSTSTHADTTTAHLTADQVTVDGSAFTVNDFTVKLLGTATTITGQQKGWTSLSAALVAPFTEYNVAGGWRGIEYRIDADGWVHVRGVLGATAAPTAGQNLVTGLPAPTAREGFDVYGSGGAGRLDLTAAGVLIYFSGITSGGYMFVSGIKYRTD